MEESCAYCVEVMDFKIEQIMIKIRKITLIIRLINSFSHGRYVSEPVGDDAFLHSVKGVHVISFGGLLLLQQGRNKAQGVSFLQSVARSVRVQESRYKFPVEGL
jgi:hypothetical protein